MRLESTTYRPAAGTVGAEMRIIDQKRASSGAKAEKQFHESRA
jgi:hypothetical protein